MLLAQCHCRECQYITGGGPNFFMAMPAGGFRYTDGEARQFARRDIPNPVTREFCPTCGTHIVTRTSMPMVIVKVGTLDDPGQFPGPKMALYTLEKQPFHTIREGLRTFDRLPG